MNEVRVNDVSKVMVGLPTRQKRKVTVGLFRKCFCNYENKLL